MHSTSQALRRPLIIISALVASIAAFTIGSGLASAHHANIVAADVACSGRVTFTTSAWEGQGEGEEFINSRTNPDVAVTYRINDAGADIAVVSGAFNEANGFQFSGSFMWPASNPDSITIYSTPQAAWGNNSPGGGFASATITWPTDCETQSTTSTTSPPTTTSTTTPPSSTTSTTTPPSSTTSTVTPDVRSGGPVPPAAPAATTPVVASLPATGSSTLTGLLIGTMLVAVGGAAAFAARRRRPA